MKVVRKQKSKNSMQMCESHTQQCVSVSKGSQSYQFHVNIHLLYTFSEPPRTARSKQNIRHSIIVICGTRGYADKYMSQFNAYRDFLFLFLKTSFVTQNRYPNNYNWQIITNWETRLFCCCCLFHDGYIFDCHIVSVWCRLPLPDIVKHIIVESQSLFHSKFDACRFRLVEWMHFTFSYLKKQLANCFAGNYVTSEIVCMPMAQKYTVNLNLHCRRSCLNHEHCIIMH